MRARTERQSPVGGAKGEARESGGIETAGNFEAVSGLSIITFLFGFFERLALYCENLLNLIENARRNILRLRDCYLCAT